MKVYRSKTESIHVNKSEAGGKVEMQGVEVVRVNEFKLRSAIQRNIQCANEVKKGSVGRVEWVEMSLRCDL